MQATAQTDTVSPVTAAELAAFIGVPSTDPLLPDLLIAATDAVIGHINIDLTQREWVGIVPALGKTRVQVSPTFDPCNTFELPYTGLISVDAVTNTEGQPYTFEVQAQRRPAKITVHDWDYKELRIEYTAGMQIIPQAIKTAIKMLASFLYEHRGACDAMDGLKKSGAVTLLRPYRVEVVI
jgi:hypothetical protein